MDLLLRGRGANISARAPLWLLRLCGAAAGFAIFVVADLLGLTDVTGFSAMLLSSCALVFGALIAPTAYGAVLWLALGVLVSITMVVGLTPIMHSAALHYVRRDARNDQVDAVVVLSGTMTADGLLSGAVMTRLLSGISEARRRNVRTIALSIIDETDGQRRVTTESDQKALMSLLAPDLAVEFVRNVKSTHDEALQFAALAQTRRWQRIVLVTSPLHTRRSCRTFEVAGLPVVCAPGQAREYTLSLEGGMHSHLNVFRDVMYETAATLVYSARGWM
ncbi:MAG: YdcF family protein [Gemmatimonadaceae bacterium]